MKCRNSPVSLCYNSEDWKVHSTFLFWLLKCTTFTAKVHEVHIVQKDAKSAHVQSTKGVYNESLQVVQLQERCLASKWRLSKNLSAHKQSSTAHFEQLLFFNSKTPLRRQWLKRVNLNLKPALPSLRPPSQSESSAQPCQTLTLDIRYLHYTS